MRVTIGDRVIGDGVPCFIIAEAGSNHNGSLEQAKRLIDVAAAAGADAIKFQLFRADRLYPRSAGRSDYLQLEESIYDVIAKLEVPYEWLPALAGHCQDRQVMFLASVFDEDSVDELEPYVAGFKIASYEMTHTALVRYTARKGKPVIVSTGAATFEEVADLVEDFRATGNGSLILMQCTASYPAPLDSLNINVIPTMKVAFSLPVGLSDHSRDPIVGPMAAVAVGANAIEKHFTLSNELPGPDHRFAVEPAELQLMIKKVREVEPALGSGKKSVHPIELELRAFARRGVFAIKDIVVGQELTRDNIAALRCGNLRPGVPPRQFEQLLGRRARRNIPAEGAIQDGDFE